MIVPQSYPLWTVNYDKLRVLPIICWEITYGVEELEIQMITSEGNLDTGITFDTHKTALNSLTSYIDFHKIKE